MKPFEEWTVLPHHELTQIDEGLLCVVGDLHMPVGDFPRRMTVARLSDGRLVIYSAIALDEHEMADLEGYGTPAFLIVPSEIHRMDARIWKARYPDIYVVAPAGAHAKVEEVVQVDATFVDLGDPHVHFVTVPGTDQHEAALLIERPRGTSLVVNDVIWNVHHRTGVGGWLLKVAGFTGDEPKIPAFIARRSIKDRQAFRQQLERWSRISNLKRIIMSHGDIVTHDAPTVLRHLADNLAA